MGVYLNIEPPAPESSWDKIKIYRSTSQSGTYSLVATQDISNLTYYDVDGTTNSWYKVRYYNSSTDAYSGWSDAIQPRAETYTTVQKVADFLQLTIDFSDSTNPTLKAIVDWIFWAEDQVEHFTNHAWREKTITNEYHDIPTRIVEGQVKWWTGMPIYLKHRSIRTFDTNQGDKLEIWDGSTWEDWVTEKTEGRADDFWVDYQNGIIYLKNITPWIWKMAVRVTYRYGETSVPYDIENLTTLLVAKQILLFEDRSVLLPAGESQNMDYRTKIEYLDQQINSILDRYREIKVVSTLA